MYTKPASLWFSDTRRYQRDERDNDLNFSLVFANFEDLPKGGQHFLQIG